MLHTCPLKRWTLGCAYLERNSVVFVWASVTRPGSCYRTSAGRRNNQCDNHSDIIYICCGMLAEWNYWQVTWYFAKPSVSSCRYLLESFVEIFHEASAGCIISDKFIDCVKVVECNEKYFRRPLYHRKLVFYRHRHQIKQFVHGGCAIKIHFVQAFNKSSKVCTVQYLDWTNKIE